MFVSKPTDIHMEVGYLHAVAGELVKDAGMFWQLFGKLICLTITRIDILTHWNCGSCLSVHTFCVS